MHGKRWRYRAWAVPPFGLRRRIFWSLVGAMLTAGILAALLTRLAAGPTHHMVAGSALLFIAVLWFASGRLAFRLVRPLNRLVDVVQRFGQGDYSARSGFSNRRDEVGRVASAIDAMAGRIENQMKEERQLLAFVSHELRTPMARIRVLTDLARSGHTSALDDIDREVADVEYLVSNILARSRLEFGNLARKPVDLPDALREAMTRAHVATELLSVDGERVHDFVSADPTLLHRAISNLIDNAQRHGGGVAAIEVRQNRSGVQVNVLDAGPGFRDSDAAGRFKAFSPSAGEGRGSGLGIGLNLVQQIVAAHGGHAWAENRAEGGARVGFELPLDGG